MYPGRRSEGAADASDRPAVGMMAFTQCRGDMAKRGRVKPSVETVELPETETGLYRDAFEASARSSRS